MEARPDAQWEVVLVISSANNTLCHNPNWSCTLGIELDGWLTRKGRCKDVRLAFYFPGGPKVSKRSYSPRFYLIGLVADSFAVAVILSSSFFVTQVIGNCLGASQRVTLGSLLLIIAVFAVHFEMQYSSKTGLWVIIILMTFGLYGIVCPFVAIAILHYRSKKRDQNKNRPAQY